MRSTCYATSSLVFPYSSSSHEQTGDTIIFEQFEEVNLVGNKQNIAKDESISASVDDSSTDDDYDDVSLSKNAIEDIWDEKRAHLDINARYYRLKIRDNIRQAISKCKGSELSVEI